MTKNVSPRLGELLESFFRHRLLVQRRASPATVATYRDGLKLFLLFVSERRGRPPSRLALEDLDRDSVLAFLLHVETQRGNCVRTRNVRLTAIRSFFQYVGYLDPASLGIVQRVLSIPGKKAVISTVNYLHKEEFSALLGAPDRSTWLGRRDYALIFFLGETGARVSEGTGVNFADLRLDDAQQVLLHGKGSKERVVPLSSGLAEVLKALADERRIAIDTETPVFVNRRGERLTRFGVTHTIRRAVAAAVHSQPSLATRHVSPHTLRHTAAMRMLQSGVDLTVIRTWLGHVSLDTTHHYAEADVEMKRRALEKCTITPAQLNLYCPPDAVLAILERL